MNVREQGFLLLTSNLGDPDRRPLTTPQLRKLTLLARAMEKPARDGELTAEDLRSIGCDSTLAKRVFALLSQEDRLADYLRRGGLAGCVPITRISTGYPDRLRTALGAEAPGLLWCKGNVSLLENPKISLVGSRDLKAENLDFAREVGVQAAKQGYTLVSGNARGADRAAQESCLAAGGSVISVVADELEKQSPDNCILYLSEEGFDLPFSAQRALHRNRIIHSLSNQTFVAQCTLGKGGTWSGSCDNLRHDRSTVICFDDGSEAARELVSRGAVGIGQSALKDFSRIVPNQIRYL